MKKQIDMIKCDNKHLFAQVKTQTKHVNNIYNEEGYMHFHIFIKICPPKIVQCSDGNKLVGN